MRGFVGLIMIPNQTLIRYVYQIVMYGKMLQIEGKPWEDVVAEFVQAGK